MNVAGHSLLGLLAGSIAGLVAAGVAPTTLDAVPVPFLVPAAVLVLVSLGAVYPDVDRRGSIPHRRVRPSLQVVAVGGVALAVAWYPDWFGAVGEALLASVDMTAAPTVAVASSGRCGAVLAVFAVDPGLGVLTGPPPVDHPPRRGPRRRRRGDRGPPLVSRPPLDGGDRTVVAILPFAFVLGVAVHRLADDV
jgi:hypothetical protein